MTNRKLDIVVAKLQRTLIPRLCRYLYGESGPFWEVIILAEPDGEARYTNRTLAVERDSSLALAICKVLAGLGKRGRGDEQN